MLSQIVCHKVFSKFLLTHLLTYLQKWVVLPGSTVNKNETGPTVYNGEWD